jgi:beta-lactamase regulating signal transducer with metallopeptidase domain
MPRASAASRHLVATVTLVALVVLPLAMAFLPQWRLPILPRRESIAAAPALQVTGAETFVKRTFDAVDGDVPFAAAAPAPHAKSAAPKPALRLPSLPRMPVVPPAPLSWPLLLALAALGASEALLLRCGVSLAAAAWFARRATPVREASVLRVFEAARERIGLERPVSLRITPRVSVPVVSGLLHPTLLLPAEALGWTPERLDVVFLHELAHVQRCDMLSILLARSSGALYWFHPVVRSLVREARRECEQACDDRVLQSGVRASAYAEHLLTIARGAAGRELHGVAVLAIARPSNLEQRLSSILRLGVQRGPATRRAVAIAALLSAVLLLPLASVRVTAAPVRATKSHTDTLVWQSASTRTRSSGAVRTAPRPIAATPRVPAVAPVPTPAPAAWDDDDASLAQGVTPLPDAGIRRSGSEWYSRARRDYERERYGAAGQEYERAAKAGHNIATAYYNSACSYALDGQHERAIAMLQAAVRAGWDDAHMLRSDDDLDSIRGDRRFARLVDEARTNDSSDDGDRKSAVAEYEALRASNSDDAGDWGSVGVDLMHNGDPARAVTAFQTQIRLRASSNAIYNLACAHALNGATGPALETLEQAIAAGFSSADHMRDDDDLASLRGNRRFDELVRLTENLELNPDDLNDRDTRGWRDELPRYQRVTQLYPTIGRAWFNLGYAQLRARDLQASRASFGRALDLKYRPGVTAYDLACVSAQLRDAGEAMRWLDRADAEGMNLTFYIQTDSDLDPIRSDPRFRALKHRMEDETWDRGRQKLKNGLDKLGRALDNF